MKIPQKSLSWTRVSDNPILRLFMFWLGYFSHITDVDFLNVNSMSLLYIVMVFHYYFISFVLN